MTMAAGKSEHDRDAAAAHAAMRAFIRAHHPDVGGDPEVFAAGLAELRAARDRARAGAAHATPADHADHTGRPSDHGDAPIVVVARPRGLRGLIQRLRSRRARKRQAPRVR